MNKIICLTDYKGHFGSKWNAVPYRSGLDKTLLSVLFHEAGFLVKYVKMSHVDFTDPELKGQFVIYTSSEEFGLHYKSFIEDIVVGLESFGAVLIPDPLYLKANNNKVFMEILRKTKLDPNIQTIDSKVFGCIDELKESLESRLISFPCVIKKAAGAMSRGVYLAHDERDLLKIAKKISYAGNCIFSIKEKIRQAKHSGYAIESSYQGKFIIQPFVENLQNDWKILIYGNKYFILKRSIRPGDFRASGSKYKYESGSKSGFPVQMLNKIRDFFLSLDVPLLSVDFGFDSVHNYIFEFQAIHFGTSTQYKSKDYYEYKQGEWIIKENDLNQEQIYVYSILNYLRRKGYV